jgi:hypothetical protein
MSVIILNGNIQLTILAILGFGRADIFVLCYFIGLKCFFAVLAWSHFMEFLLVILLKVNIEHLSAGGALFNIPPAVAKMCGNFGLWKEFETVITTLCGLISH